MEQEFADGEISNEQRWTPARAVAVVRAYRTVLRQWRRRPWPTTVHAHECTHQCRLAVQDDVAICLATGGLHVCGDVCDRAHVTHEARVCLLTRRAFPRDFCPDTFDGPTPVSQTSFAVRQQQRQVASARRRKAPGPKPSRDGGIGALLPAGVPPAELERLRAVACATWDLVLTSTLWPRVKQLYTREHHAVVVLRLMVHGMHDEAGRCLVPASAYVAEHVPSLKAMVPDPSRLLAHTRATKTFRRLLHGVSVDAIRQHEQTLALVGGVD